MLDMQEAIRKQILNRTVGYPDYRLSEIFRHLLYRNLQRKIVNTKPVMDLYGTYGTIFVSWKSDDYLDPTREELRIPFRLKTIRSRIHAIVARKGVEWPET